MRASHFVDSPAQPDDGGKMSAAHFRDSIKLPKPGDSSPDDLARGPPAAQMPLPHFPAVLPRPPPSAVPQNGKAAAARGCGKVDGKWMQDAWQSVKGMERKWQRLRDARGTAVQSALYQATAVISEVSPLIFLVDIYAASSL